MDNKHADIISTSTPVDKICKTKSRRLSRWFVNNQKYQAWDESALNTIHIRIFILMTFVYVCHIIGSPFIRFVDHQNTLVAIYVLETLFLIVSILYFVKMCYVNGSWAATKFMFDKTSIRTYIFLFWMLRCFVIEILKGQIIYSFVTSFHSIMIFSTDTWYICDRKILIASMVLYILMLVYEFFVSISPVGPTKPSWNFMHVKTTANSLSRSNYFNLFVIFFDALIVLIHDVKRSKYMMMVKKRNREMLQVSTSKKYMLKRLWILFAATGFLGVLTFVMEVSLNVFTRILPGLGYIIYGTVGGISICSFFVILYYSSSSKATSTLFLLMHERRVIFIVLLLGILFYVDIFYLKHVVQGVIFQILIVMFVSFDLIVLYFPRRLALTATILIILLLCWNIFSHSFLQTDCKKYMLPWGVYGEDISYCTIRRLVYQSILSLMVSAAKAIFDGRINNLFFCNVNIYRSRGTVNRHTTKEDYILSMRRERDNSIDAKKTNTAVEMT